MSDAPDERAGEGATRDESESLRERVEEKYDFDDFGPADMAAMSANEWEAAFDPDAWVTGERLLDRVEDDLRARVAAREVFARIERVDAAAIAGETETDEGETDGTRAGETPTGETDLGAADGGAGGDVAAADDAGGSEDGRETGERSAPAGDGSGERLLAYSDEGYAIVYPDGSVEGRGTVVRDVKPVVALCSMPDYEVPEPPADAGLPEPREVPEGGAELGNRMLQVVAAAQVVAGVALLVATVALPGAGLVAGVAGLGFLVVGAFLFLVVANARLSDRFRAEEFRNRLRAAGVAPGERPEFVPVEDDE